MLLFEKPCPPSEIGKCCFLSLLFVVVAAVVAALRLLFENPCAQQWHETVMFLFPPSETLKCWFNFVVGVVAVVVGDFVYAT